MGSRDWWFDGEADVKAMRLTMDRVRAKLRTPCECCGQDAVGNRLCLGCLNRARATGECRHE